MEALAVSSRDAVESDSGPFVALGSHYYNAARAVNGLPVVDQMGGTLSRAPWLLMTRDMDNSRFVSQKHSKDIMVIY